MTTNTPAFAASSPLYTSARSLIPATSVTPLRPTNVKKPGLRSPSVRMEATPAVETEPRTLASWPPPEMTEDWADAVLRLAKAVPETSLDAADAALDETDGDEPEALRLLMDSNWSDIRRKRELAVATARANGDVNRVSAVKEAELRRKATGSAQDFFKSYVEIEGSYVDAGYVDEDADAIGKMVKGFKNLFGGKKEEKKDEI